MNQSAKIMDESTDGVDVSIGTNDLPANDGVIDSGSNLDIVLEIPVTLSLEIGRTRMRIADLLKLSTGSVIDLNKMVDEPLDILVNGRLVAQGEAVVIDGKFGVRVTDIISQQERLKNIR